MKNVYFSLAAALCLPLCALADGSYSSGKNTETSVSGNVTVSGKTELHITSQTAPVAAGTVINLVDDDSWLFFDGVKPSVVRDNYLGNIKVNGQPAVYHNLVVDNAFATLAGGASYANWEGDNYSADTNVRLAEWGSGTVVIPNGIASGVAPLTVYENSYCDGESKTFGLLDHFGSYAELYPNAQHITYAHNDLGEWDNRIVSFKLKRGYWACFANNSDGSGHSRVYIAADDDLTINVLPEGFVTHNGANGTRYVDGVDKSFVSFIRVGRWCWSGKKGWSGGSAYEITLANADTYYNWSKNKIWKHSDGFDRLDREFMLIKQNGSAPKYEHMDTIQGITHVSGFNEPDRPDQANLDVAYAIKDWPNMMRLGYRIGSPCPSTAWTSWGPNFYKEIERYNYRCDYDVLHMYEYVANWSSAMNKVNSYNGGRPVWVTEYNNGANWTTESNWPNASGTKVDVDGNPILDSNGKTQTVNRPATAANMEHQRQWTVNILPWLENYSKLEHYYFYNWVEDARSYVLSGKLTPAGQVFAAHISKPGYNAANEYAHTWKIAPAPLTCVSGYYLENVNITFYDHNGETGTGYDIYGLTKNGGYQVVKHIDLGVDYQAGDNVTVSVPYDKEVSVQAFHIVATSYKGSKSDESPNFTVTKPTLAGGFGLRVKNAAGNTITLEWDAVEGAEDYTIFRGSNASSLKKWDVGIKETEYVDETDPKTRYAYQVEACNKNCGNSKSKTVSAYSGEVTGIDDVDAGALEIKALAGGIQLSGEADAPVAIYAIDGRMVENFILQGGATMYIQLAPGLYIVNHQKVLVK